MIRMESRLRFDVDSVDGKPLNDTDFHIGLAAEGLAEMELEVPWLDLMDLIEPSDPMTSKKSGRPPNLLAP